MATAVKAPRGMLPATSNFKQELARLNHFVWPAAGSLWNLRWQVQGFLQVRPDATDRELSARFLSGSDLQERVDFRQSCSVDSWHDQQQLLAEMVLLAIFGLYEGWLEQAQSEIDEERHLELEWPSRSVGLRKNQKTGALKDGIDEGLTDLGACSSSFMTKHFRVPAENWTHYWSGSLDDLMIAYRYWKEVRNAIVHRGRRATDPLIEVQELYQAVTPERLEMKRRVLAEPAGRAQEVGGTTLLEHDDSISVPLYGVFNLAHILNRLVVTLDYRLASTEIGGQRFQERLKKQTGWRDPANRNLRAVRRGLNGLNHPEPEDVEVFLQDLLTIWA